MAVIFLLSKFFTMKTLFSILFYAAAGLYVCLSYFLVHMIGTDGKFGFIVLDLAGLLVNIALINELALIFNRLGIDTEEVLSAAGSKWNQR